MKLWKALMLSLLLLALTVSVCIPANAGGVWEWQGAGNTIPFVSDQDCRIVIEKAVITYDIPSFPMKDLKEPNYDYTASVTAEYSLYNPTEEDVTLNLWLPMWDKGEYYHEWGLHSGPEIPFTMTIGEIDVPYTTGYVAVKGNQPVLSADDVGTFGKEMIQDDFFFPEQKVTVYTYPLGPAIAHLDGDELRYFGFELPEIGESTRIAFPGMDCCGTYYDYETDKETTFFAVERFGMEWMNPEADLSLRVYFLGEAPAEPLYPAVFLKWNEEHAYFRDKILASPYLDTYTVEEMTLLQLADSLNPSDKEYSQMDWYNGLVSKMLWDTVDNPEGILTLDHGYQSDDWKEEWEPSMEFYTYEHGYQKEKIDLWDNMMEYASYTVTLKAGERLSHKIRMHLYPTIYHSFDWSTYKYMYVLSTAKSWGSVENMEFVIRTPYVMDRCSMDGFRREGDCYRLSVSGLPNEELYFELEEKPWDMQTEPTEQQEELHNEPTHEAEIVKKGNLKPWILAGALILMAASAALFLSLRHKKNVIDYKDKTDL